MRLPDFLTSEPSPWHFSQFVEVHLAHHLAEKIAPQQKHHAWGGGVGVGDRDVRSLFSFWWSVCEGTSRNPWKVGILVIPLKWWISYPLSVKSRIFRCIPVLWFQWKVNVIDKQVQVPMLKLNKILIWLVGLGYTQPMNASWDAMGILNSFFHPTFLLLPSLGYWIRCSALPQHFKETLAWWLWLVVGGWWFTIS